MVDTESGEGSEGLIVKGPKIANQEYKTPRPGRTDQAIQGLGHGKLGMGES